MNPILKMLPESDPAMILRFRDRQFAAELLAAALLHLDLFTWLAQHAGADDAQICRELELHARPLDVLLTLCRASGLVQTDAAGKNTLTVQGREHLVVGSPWYLGPYYAPIRDTPAVQGFLRVLRTGKPANWQAKSDGKDWHTSMQDAEFARSFTELMNCRGLVFGQHLARALTPHLEGRSRVLDVGGGSGIYSSTLVAAHAHIQATVLEQPPVDGIVRAEITKHGLEGRVDVCSGDMFTMQWPQADVVLLSNVLHDWDWPEAQVLVNRAAAALPAGGLLVVHDAFIADDKCGPLPAAEYSALLMHITQGKCYSAAEYAEMMRAAGLAPGHYQPTVADRGFMTAVKR
ncbi:MAG: methyltransferase domain-containing protein [Verrucomicrobiaceae bacterium]|nr:methyltransferase domain-containing protein [Verrucomicrobiaceae bacterium]